MANKDSSRVSFNNRKDIKVKIPFKKIKTKIRKNQKQKSTRSFFGNKKRSHNNTQRALLHASHATKKKEGKIGSTRPRPKQKAKARA